MNTTKHTKHFSALKKGDNFTLVNKHLVFIKRIHGDRIVCKTHGYSCATFFEVVRMTAW